MKYSHEIINLIGAFPGRVFVMRQLVRHVNPRASRSQYIALQRGIHRVMVALAATGVAEITPPEKIGGQNKYSWKPTKPRHENV